jgi:uncharacterized protein with NAD-binding domain and iron-sulfur cluster
MSKVAIAGAGWAGLGAAYHLAKQGYDVTLLARGLRILRLQFFI